MASKDSQKPNIVFLLSDDQGAWATGYGGNTEIQTPNLDFLASSGVAFRNCFCTSPVCSPARASILTGSIPSWHGVHDWIDECEHAGQETTFLAEQRAYTDYLKENGYTCGISGKWHLGNSRLAQHGFDHWYVHQKGGGDYFHAPMIKDGEPIVEDGYITDLITDDAITFMKSCLNEENPFYASIHYTAPHVPWIRQHPKKYVDLYAGCTFESCRQGKKHPWARFSKDRNATPEAALQNPKEYLQGYYAAVTAMDMNIGRIIVFLQEHDLIGSTLVCFMSDNGFSCGQHGFWGKGNGTYPMNMYEYSVKVPALMSQPGRIPQGIVTDALISGYDVMPTLLNYVGIPYHDALKPGRNLSSLIQGDVILDEDQPIVVLSEYGPVRMIRTKKWKYIHRFPDGPHELFDLDDDPEEMRNLVDDDSMKAVVKSLKADLDHWFEKYSIPAHDGKALPVYGEGQVCRIDSIRNGQTLFNRFDS